jgi:hypothetical protein
MICLYQALVRTLLAQNEDGSWGPIGSREETAYGVLLISKASVLPCLDSIRPNIESALESAKRFIQDSSEDHPSYLWVEKVTYGSEVLCESYLLAALRANISETKVSTKTRSLVHIPEASVAKFVKFYSNIPLFSNMAPWKLQASLIEGYLFLPQLKQMRLNIFPRSGMEEDKYFEYIPFTWTAINNLNKTFLPTKSLRDMMVISFLNYQADEYMEAVVGRYFGTHKKELLAIVDDIFSRIERKEDQQTNGSEKQQADRDLRSASPEAPLTPPNEPSLPEEQAKPTLSDVRTVLEAFIKFVMQHPSVLEASSLATASVKMELRTFLAAHIEQSEDNDRFAAQGLAESARTTFQTPRSSFYRWVQSTSSDHTSCPYSFHFYQCLLGQDKQSASNDCFQSTEEKYIAEAMCRHLAVMCRMYNDYGSVARDREEMNLNSVNFPDFTTGKNSLTDVDGLKKQLFTVAEYERKNMESAMTKLWELAGVDKTQRRTLDKVQMFCNVTDLYGQIYVARDIASRM